MTDTDDKGIRCPTCGSRRSRVYDSRQHNEGIKRRRKCRKGHRFATLEKPVRLNNSSKKKADFAKEAIHAIRSLKEFW